MTAFRQATYVEVSDAIHAVNQRTVTMGRPAGE